MSLKKQQNTNQINDRRLRALHNFFNRSRVGILDDVKSINVAWQGYIVTWKLGGGRREAREVQFEYIWSTVYCIWRRKIREHSIFPQHHFLLVTWPCTICLKLMRCCCFGWLLSVAMLEKSFSLLNRSSHPIISDQSGSRIYIILRN